MNSDPQTRCPVCNAVNDCGMAQGKGNCWCFTEAVEPEVAAVLTEVGIDDRCMCSDCAAGSVPSPCLSVCALEPDAQVCTGCHRTIDEITKWSKMSPAERARVQLRLRAL